MCRTARLGHVLLTQGDRNAHEIDVIGLILEPRLDVRLQRIAVRAVIPEQFHYFDFARRESVGCAGTMIW